MIARDRGVELARALATVRDVVDEIVVVLAGRSSDDTEAVARSFGARIVEFYPETYPEAFYLDTEERFAKYDIPGPFSGRQALADFSAPRNLSFRECTGDYIFWIDSDDLVRGADKLRAVIAKMDDHKLPSVFFEYEYEKDEAGRCIVRQIRERIVRRADFLSGKIKWSMPIHEHIVGLEKGGLFPDLIIEHASPTTGGSVTEVKGLKIHTTHRNHVRWRNLKNLIVEKERLDAAGEEVPWRLSFYLGVEMRSVDPARAIEYLREYLPKAPWDEERAQARHYIGQIREMEQKNEEAWDAYAGAAVDFPGNPSPLFGLARLAFVKGEWNKVIELTEKGFSQINGETHVKKPSLIVNPLEWRYKAHLPYSRALFEVGRIEEASKSCEAGLKVEPDCPYLGEHRRMIRAYKEEKLPPVIDYPPLRAVS